VYSMNRNASKRYLVCQQHRFRYVVMVMIFGLCATQALAQCREQQKLSDPDPFPLDHFGESVSVSGNTVITGAWRDDCASGIDCGAVYVSRFNGVSWELQQKLTASDAASGDSFGSGIFLNGNTAIVGAHGDDCAAGSSCGSVYMFRFNGTSWVQAQKLTASDAAASAHFGQYVSLSGDTAVVGAGGVGCAAGLGCGAAYVFRFNGTSWVQAQKLVASDAGKDDLFGGGVAISGDTIAVGAFNDECADGRCGSAYVFRFNGASWQQEQKLTASDAADRDYFGRFIAVSGGTVMVGAHFNDSAYMFRFNGASWQEEQKLTASDSPPAGELFYFGASVSLSGDRALVGAPSHNCAAGRSCGLAYLFRFDGTTWVQEHTLTASDERADHDFGLSVSVSGDITVVGGPVNQISMRPGDLGSIYMFDFSSNAASPLAATAPHDITKDRYLSFDPSNNPGQMTALRVTRVGSSASVYVSCTLQNAGVDGMFSELVQTAEFCEWTDSVIHVRGCEIVPGNQYMIEATLDDVIFTCPLQINTTVPQFSAHRQFGDLVGAFVGGVWTAPEGVVTSNDIVAVVQKFRQLDTAPHLSRVDNDGQTPNGIISGSDILREVIAFSGGDFSFGTTGCLTGTCVPICP